jgi:hypothetical protein
MEGAIHQHRMRFNGSPNGGARRLLRGWFPNYPKDADAAFAELPYNSSSRTLSDGGSYPREIRQDD